MANASITIRKNTRDLHQFYSVNTEIKLRHGRSYISANAVSEPLTAMACRCSNASCQQVEISRFLSVKYLVSLINYYHINKIEHDEIRRPVSIRVQLKIQVSKDLEIGGEAAETGRFVRDRQSRVDTTDRFEQLTARLRQREPPVAARTLFERNQPAFEQGMEFSAIHVDLLRRMTKQHQRGNFMWT